MTLTIRCTCGATYTVDDNPPAGEPSNDPGDTTTHAQHHGWADTGLGFTTPALTTEEK